MGTNTAGGHNRTRFRTARVVGAIGLAAMLAAGFGGAIGAPAVLGSNGSPAAIFSAIESLVPVTRASERDARSTEADSTNAAGTVEPSAPVTSDIETPDGTFIETENGAISAIESDFHVEPILSPVLLAEWRYGGADDVDADPVTDAAAVATASAPASTPQAPVVAGPALRPYGFSFAAIGVRAQGTAYFGCNAPGSLAGSTLYRWGCAGSNNTYLLGHAFGAFKPLNAAYHAGTLKVGLTAWYAGRDGVARQYRVTEIRHVRMSDWSRWGGWAKASLSRPGLTLQTCDGAGDIYRIVVRLTLV